MAEPVLISCRDVWREISNYLENAVSPEERAALEAHFRTCRHCTAILDGTRNVIELACDNRTFSLPARFSERLAKRIRAASRKH